MHWIGAGIDGIRNVAFLGAPIPFRCTEEHILSSWSKQQGPSGYGPLLRLMPFTTTTHSSSMCVRCTAVLSSSSSTSFRSRASSGLSSFGRGLPSTRMGGARATQVIDDDKSSSMHACEAKHGDANEGEISYNECHPASRTLESSFQLALPFIFRAFLALQAFPI